MLVRSALFLGLACTGGAAHGDVEGVVNSTAQVIRSLQEQGDRAKRRFANVSEFERQLDRVGHHAEADFDVQLYSNKTRDYTELAERASKKAAEASSSTNATVAEELSDEAEALLRNMTKVGFELDGIEQDFRDELKRALGATLDPELAAADSVTSEASHLQKRSHSMMDPLYSWGDAAEDKADKLNDQTNDALSAVDKIVRPYRRDIARRSREVQRAVERKLFESRDRTAVWRKVNRRVRASTYHALRLRSLADASTLSLQLGSFGGVAVLTMTSAVAAAVGAFVGFAVQRRTQQRSDYQFLSA
mmetsp:Transcript_109198/g.305299  ORF Transcript_109198/g.305299 Transcript_109198/m.305299 type:complete len:305 (-) Transcript_109198:210-1124(-)